MLEIRVDSNIPGVQRDYKRIAEKIDDLSPIWKEYIQFEKAGHDLGGRYGLGTSRWKKLHGHHYRQTKTLMETATFLNFKPVRPRKPIKPLTGTGQKELKSLMEKWFADAAKGN